MAVGLNFRATAGLGLVLSLILALAGCAPSTLPDRAGDSLRVASHNVHFIRLTKQRGPWSVADWETRKQALDTVFKEADADLIAFQEMVSIGPGPERGVNLARDWLLERNPGYALAATGDWRHFPTRQPIFYRPDKLRLIDHGWFFHDPPEVVARDRQKPGFWLYFTAWADFEDGQGRPLRVYNLHFDFAKPARRRQAAQIVAKHMEPALKRGVPVLVMGDMNALSGWRTVDILRGVGLTMAEPRGTSFHFNRGLHLFGPIDRMGSAHGLTLTGGPWALRGRRAGDWPSDHYPVVADLALP